MRASTCCLRCGWPDQAWPSPAMTVWERRPRISLRAIRATLAHVISSDFAGFIREPERNRGDPRFVDVEAAPGRVGRAAAADRRDRLDLAGRGRRASRTD